MGLPKACPYCGGIIGRDCVNVEECGDISRQKSEDCRIELSAAKSSNVILTGQLARARHLCDLRREAAEAANKAVDACSAELAAANVLADANWGYLTAARSRVAELEAAVNAANERAEKLSADLDASREYDDAMRRTIRRVIPDYSGQGIDEWVTELARRYDVALGILRAVIVAAGGVAESGVSLDFLASAPAEVAARIDRLEQVALMVEHEYQRESAEGERALEVMRAAGVPKADLGAMAAALKARAEEAEAQAETLRGAMAEILADMPDKIDPRMNYREMQFYDGEIDELKELVAATPAQCVKRVQAAALRDAVGDMRGDEAVRCVSSARGFLLSLADRLDAEAANG